MKLLNQIADALANGLEEKSFSLPSIAVQRVNWPSYNVEDMANPVIAVMPVGDTIERVSRQNHQHDYSVAVFVGRHTPTDDMADEMLDLAEEIVDAILLHDWQSVNFPTSSPQSIQIEINPDDALQERNVWRAMITVTYRTFR